MIDLQEKVDLLFTHPPHGQRLTYSDVQRLGNVEPAALSRIRSGQTKEPSYLTVQGLATAFQIPVEYFYAPVTRDEAITYLTDIENAEVLQLLQQRVQDERQQKIADIALRASHLDEEGIDAIAQMIDYVLKRNPK